MATQTLRKIKVTAPSHKRSIAYKKLHDAPSETKPPVDTKLQDYCGSPTSSSCAPINLSDEEINMFHSMVGPSGSWKRISVPPPGTIGQNLETYAAFYAAMNNNIIKLISIEDEKLGILGRLRNKAKNKNGPKLCWMTETQFTHFDAGRPCEVPGTDSECNICTMRRNSGEQSLCFYFVDLNEIMVFQPDHEQARKPVEQPKFCFSDWNTNLDISSSQSQKVVQNTVSDDQYEELLKSTYMIGCGDDEIVWDTPSTKKRVHFMLDEAEPDADSAKRTKLSA